MYIEKINTANDIKKIDKKNLPSLAKEIRTFLLENVSKTGGHLASNLGAVELTMALHYCLDMEKDKIVWDVGHQAYVHKILTGRKKDFPTLRTLDGLCGFPKPSESKYDSFVAGHSSTSISAAFGMAVARDMRGSDERIFAVIGDGSFTGGMVYEAMNNAGRSGKDIVVILNDNEMSISGNVGAVSRHLSDLRTQSSYLNAKERVHKAINKMPESLGKPMEKGLRFVKDGVKHMLVSGVLFEEMGFNYIGQIDGHDINELIEVIGNIKKMHGPILLHVKTKKGKGYAFAEKDPSKFHGIGKFDVKTGKTVSKGDVKNYSDVFGDTLCAMAETDKKIAAVSAAMIDGTGLQKFAEKYPKRMFDVGIAEQHAVTFSAGMAALGMKPVFAVYSTFLQRGYDQIVHDVCLQK
ncbi:MAG: 1-deoxy-D-xylulose-5-phosphate synthase, partial [Firmicutes bacterium]|nr:1-deoxy-D-xylulose-5-phosphate synthase [Bacillota bacterium]